jgi:hypothetical protein
MTNWTALELLCISVYFEFSLEIVVAMFNNHDVMPLEYILQDTQVLPKLFSYKYGRCGVVV